MSKESKKAVAAANLATGHVWDDLDGLVNVARTLADHFDASDHEYVLTLAVRAGVVFG